MAETDSSKTTFEAANDSWLDSSDSCNFKIETKKKGAGKVKDDDDDDVTASTKETSYVPVKGQKMAAKRLKKIQGSLLSLSMCNIQLFMHQWIKWAKQKRFVWIKIIVSQSHNTDTLAKGLVDTEKLQKQKSKATKATKTSPSKRTQRAGRRGVLAQHSMRNYVELDDLDSDSDLDDPIAAHFAFSAHRVPMRRTPRDPNTIVLDCDDEFDGGPAVNFTRNIAGANAVSVEQSQEMKVNVRINTKIEQFQMNPVS